MLSEAAGFASLPRPFLEELAQSLEEENVAAGAPVVDSGEAGKLYVVASGSAELAGPGEDQPALGKLSSGELFGDLSAISAFPAPAVRAVALTELRLLSLTRGTLDEFFVRHPESREVIQAAGEEIAVAHFLKAAVSPFRTLDVATLRTLAARLEPVNAGADEVIFRQGDAGDCCYLVRSGSVEVVSTPAEGEERRLAVLGPGMIFGEVALLTEERRNATVRALEPSGLLVLYRRDLLEAIAANRGVRQRFLDMVEWRSRPRRAPGVHIQQLTGEAGETITILKRPAAHAITGYRLWVGSYTSAWMDDCSCAT